MKRESLERELSKTLLWMKVVYSSFSAGLLLLLTTTGLVPRGLGWFLAAVPALVVIPMTRKRDCRILDMGYSADQPIPPEWSEDYHQKEVALFRRFTTLWTLAVFGWALTRYIWK